MLVLVRMKIRLIPVILAFSLLAGFVSLPGAQATHGRGSNSFYENIGGNTVEITLFQAFRLNAALPCFDATWTNVPCTGAGGAPGVGDVFEDNQGGTVFFLGDGNDVRGSSLTPFVATAVDSTNNVVYAKMVDPVTRQDHVTHTYAQPGVYTGYVDSCCRLSPDSYPFWHENNGDGTYRYETKITVDGVNRGPTSSTDLFTLCTIDSVCVFSLSGADADGDTVRCRLPTAGESSGLIQPPGLMVSNDCIVTWDTTGAALGPAGYRTIYSAQVMVADLGPSGGEKSHEANDFFIELTSAGPNTPGAPVNPSCAPGLPGEIDLAWMAPFSNGGSPITHYNIYRGVSPGGEAFLTQVGVQYSYTDSGLVPGGTYYYTISAVNAVGIGPQSVEVTCVAPGRGTDPPVPELPSIALALAGLAGVAGLVLVRRKA